MSRRQTPFDAAEHSRVHPLVLPPPSPVITLQPPLFSPLPVRPPLAVLGHACATLSVLVAGVSEMQRKAFPLVEQTLSGKVLHVSSMPCFRLVPQYILLGVAEALVTPACEWPRDKSPLTN